MNLWLLSYSITAAATWQSEDDDDSNHDINDYDENLSDSITAAATYKSDDEDGNLLG